MQSVYKVFDLDGSGEVGFDELFVLGQARRELGQKEGVWTAEKNERVMELIGRDATGDVPMGNFSAFFEECLPIDEKEFEARPDAQQPLLRRICSASSPCHGAHRRRWSSSSSVHIT